MNARERLELMVRTDRGSMTVWSPRDVSEALDAYRAEVLRKQADITVAYCPDHGDRDTCRMSCHCAIADEMRKDADKPVQG